MHKQRGFSFFGLAFLVAILGAIVSLGIKVIPPYIDFLTISGAAQEIIKQPRMALQTNDAILRKIDTQMSINNMHLRDFEKDAVVVYREDGQLVAEIDYTLQEPVFSSEEYEISLNLHFTKTHAVDLGGD